MPTLFDESLSPHPQRPCPKCRRPVDVRVYCRRGTRANAWCPACHVLAADEGLWLECWAWCKANVKLLRRTLEAVRPDLDDLADDIEVCLLSIASVVQSAVGHDLNRESKFSTWVVGLLKLAARRMPHGGDAATGVEWSRVEERAG